MATRGATCALRRFELDGVKDTGREVGRGSYAVVKELEYHGLKCVGKMIHGILFESATSHEKADLLERFVGECELLAGLHHPCIVQFLGVWFEQGSQVPVLVMEYLHTTLSDCLQRYGVLHEEISYGILRDVALGLRYLHERSPPIVHRDLSANNVLLTPNMNAKISDLGVAKIFNMPFTQMGHRTQTKAPGTPCYMPPEALTAKPKYTTKIDIYSYGVLIIHTLCGRWPFPEDVFRPDPQNPDKLIPISEIERRAEYLQEIGKDHPLLATICQCLSNVPAQRPEAPALFDRVNTVLSGVPKQFTNRIEMLQQYKPHIQNSAETNHLKRSEIDKKPSVDTSLRAEFESLSVQSPLQQTHSQHTSQPDPTHQPSLTGQPDVPNQVHTNK